jgi:inhibitor of cysteine peptidase
MTIIDKSFHGKKIVAQKGDIIHVQLAENPTTGYLWKIKSHDDKHLHFIKKENEISGSEIGAGGMNTFYLEVISEGTSDLHLTHGNSWENDAIDTFNVSIES